jgi:hypothetical protein
MKIAAITLLRLALTTPVSARIVPQKREAEKKAGQE